MRRLGASIALLAVLAAAAPAAESQQRPRWNVRVLAKMPPPGYPAYAYVHPNGRIYVGNFTNPRGDSVRSRVLEFLEDGTLVRSWTLPSQNVSGEQGVQAATSDARGNLVLLDRDPARVLKLDRGTGLFSRYATFADLRPCPTGQTAPNCSPTSQDLTPVPNYAAWGPDASIYVTDFQQGVLWRVPPGGGAAQIWLADPRLDGGTFGTTGILLGADRRTLFFAQGSSGSPGGALGGLNPATGKLYSVAIQSNGRPGPLRELWESGPADLPDGFAIALSGRFYVPLAGGANEIAVVAPDGRELERRGNENFDTPSSARFLGTRLIVPNQAFATGDFNRQTILDVEVGERGLPEFIPGLDLRDPVISRLSVRPNVFRTRRPRTRRAARRRPARRPAFTGARRIRVGTRIRFRLSEAAAVTFRVERRRGRRWRHRLTFTRRRKAGRNSMRFSGRVRVRRRLRRLRVGRYRVILRAEDPAGNESKAVRRRFRVVR